MTNVQIKKIELNAKMTKNEIVNELKNCNIECNFNKLTKQQLIDLYNDYFVKIENVEIVEMNEIALLNEMNETLMNEKFSHFDENENVNDENIENDSLTMFDEYIEFLNETNSIFKIENDIIIVIANKKHIFVKIDNEKMFAYVFTILNKKMSNDLNECKKHARNILTLKSLKATKSYTISNMK